MRLTCKKIGINGEGIAYYNQKPVFVDDLLLNEIADIEIIDKFPKYYIGKVNKIIKQNPARKSSFCKHVNCSGCDLKAVDLNYQKLVKSAILKQAIQKYNGRLNYKMKPFRMSDSQTSYRNAFKLPVMMSKGKLVNGLYENNSNNLKEIEDCLVHETDLEKIRKQVLNILNAFNVKAYDSKTKQGLRYMIMRGFNEYYQLTLVMGKDHLSKKVYEALASIPNLVSIYESHNTQKQSNNLWGHDLTKQIGDTTLNFDFMGLKLYLHPQSFFQLNTKQAQNLYEYVISLTSKAHLVVEGYCGVGVMSLLVSKQVDKVIGIEIVDSAIEDAKKIAEINKINNCTFINGDFEKEITKIDQDAEIDYLIVDPPRSGLSNQVITTLNKLKIKNIIYISCNPSTLSKNISKLNYHLEHIKGFDMFPNGHHVESVALLKR